MGSLSSELATFAEQHSRQPRVYADANLPAGVVGFMRTRLAWDVFFVMEHEELRRARDDEHYRRARDMRRTLVTLDHDYLDDRRFPPRDTAGVLVVAAPDERQVMRVLSTLDRRIFRPRDRSGAPDLQRTPLPLAGRKLLAGPDRL
jgi:hypothetical protein